MMVGGYKQKAWGNGTSIPLRPAGGPPRAARNGHVRREFWGIICGEGGNGLVFYAELEKMLCGETQRCFVGVSCMYSTTV